MQSNTTYTPIVTDASYHNYLDSMRTRFDAIQAPSMFHAGIDGSVLWSNFLLGIDADRRQHWTCNCCRHFVERFGNVVLVGDDGVLTSAIWDETDAPAELRDAIWQLRQLVEDATVNGVFLHDKGALGTPEAGGFRHFSLNLDIRNRLRSSVLTPFQAMAEKDEDFRILGRALSEFDVRQLEDAARILNADAVSRAQKFADHVEWLLRIKHRTLDRSISHKRQVNLRWLDVATAPAGWCKPRGQMIGTLLEDLAAGIEFDSIKRRWNEKMHPLQYQRPQAAPSAGTIEQAEKLVEKLGIAPSLARRFARIDEVEAVWKPSPVEPAQARGGVFGGIKAKGEVERKPLALPSQRMTWEKFARTVLPTVREIELCVPNHGDFVGLVTAVDQDAPPILKWDREDARNPVSWYRYAMGSSATQWGLSSRTWSKVTAVTHLPSAWKGAKASDIGIFFLIEGARDVHHKGSALFPEIMRSELHGVRSVIEAYSKQHDLQGFEEASACGLVLSNQNGVQIRARGADGAWLEYNLDRID